MARRLAPLACVIVLAWSGPVAAWNPVKAFVAKVKDVGRSIGSVLGSPVGGFVDAMAQPTIHDAEDSAHRVVHDVDAALGREIDRAGGVATTTIALADKAAQDRLAQVDHSLEARIVQVKAGADDTIARAFDRVDNLVGRLDDIARKRIDQIQNVANQLLYTFDADLNRLLAAADDILVRRLADVRALVTDALQQADQIAQARIDQLDEIASKRIGNVDVVATKQTLSLEQLLLRLAAVVAMVAFAALVLWWLFKSVGNGWALQPPHLGVLGKLRGTLLPSIPLVVYQLVIAGAGLLLLHYLAIRLPRDSERRSKDQITAETRAFTAARHALDMREARYHEAQLALLDGDQALRNHALLGKAELVHTVFTRPTKLQTAGGLADLVQTITELERQLGENDPDLLVVKAFITWQVGGDRSDELEAALLCAQALEAHGRDHSDDFMLAMLAKHYVTIVLDENLAKPADVTRLRAALALPHTGADSEYTFAQTTQYDTAVRKLRDAAIPAYLDMLSAQARLQLELDKPKRDAPAVDKARTARTEAAKQVVAAWKAFDEVLSSPAMSDDTVGLAAFTLDDAVLSHALYFTSAPTANGLAPPLATVDARKPPPKPPANTLARTDVWDPKLEGPLRMKIAPLRVEWARRFAPLLGSSAQQVLAFQESQRFKAFEQRAHDFEVAYVGYLMLEQTNAKDTRLPDLGAAAAVSAANMGLFTGTGAERKSEATKIAAALGSVPDDVRDEIDAAGRRRLVRLL